MPQPTLSVRHRVAGGSTWTTLSNITSIDLSNGRRTLSDGIRPGLVSLEGRVPSSLPTLKIGDTLEVTITLFGTSVLKYYRLSDFVIHYGIVSNADTWIINGEDGIAFIGRSTYTGTWPLVGPPITNSRLAAADVMTQCGTYMDSFSGFNDQTVEAKTFAQASAGEVMQNLVNTEQAIIVGNNINGITWLGRGWQYNLTTVYASDDGSGTSPANYDQLVFRSLADNYGSLVNASNSTTTKTSGTSGPAVNVPTYSNTAAQLQDVADFVRQVYSVQSQTPSEISFLLNSQANNTAIRLGNSPGTYLLVTKFRGTTYTSIPLGVQITGTPESMRVKVFLQDATAYSFFVLNDPTFGTLDYNKLGF